MGTDYGVSYDRIEDVAYLVDHGLNIDMFRCETKSGPAYYWAGDLEGNGADGSSSYGIEIFPALSYSAEDNKYYYSYKEYEPFKYIIYIPGQMDSYSDKLDKMIENGEIKAEKIHLQPLI